MKNSDKRTKQNLSIHQKIRSAKFIDYNYLPIETFKYKVRTKVKVYRDLVNQRIKKFISQINNRSIQIYNSVIWDRLIYNISIWLFEAFVEGLTLNYVLHILLGYPMNIWTIFAYGILIKQGLDIYWRMRINGETTTIPKENK